MTALAPDTDVTALVHDPYFTDELIHQVTWWVTADGDMVQVADMLACERLEAAGALERCGGDFDITGNPLPLYEALLSMFPREADESDRACPAA